MQSASGCRAVADLLRGQSAKLLDEWRQRVLVDPCVPAADRLSTPSLIDHFPALIERLAQAIERVQVTEERPSLVGRQVGGSEASHAHAADRFAAGFTLAQVLRELAHLRAVILEHFESSGMKIDSGCSKLVHASIDEMMTMGAREMARLDKEAIEEQAEIARREHARADEANRLKDVFLATLSHELRTPLNAILGWTRMLRTGTMDRASFERALEAIERNSFAQARLVDELLDMSRITSGKMQLEKSTIDIVAVVRGAIDAVRPSADAKQIRLHVSGASDARTRGDPDRLKQVFWNLLANAIKFSKAGDAVDLEVTKGERTLRVRIADQGAGIGPESIDRIFERFQQADMSPTRPHGGLGLGLAIVRELVELHEGTVEAQSDGLGKGATFVVILPLA